MDCLGDWDKVKGFVKFGEIVVGGRFLKDIFDSKTQIEDEKEEGSGRRGRGRGGSA